LSGLVLAQSDTASVKKNKVRPIFIPIADFEAFNIKTKAMDTSLDMLSQLNPFRKTNMAYQDLGLIGTAIQPLSLSTLKKTGFDLGFNTMNTWMFQNGSNERIIVAPTPYTMIHYSQGAKDLIFLNILHTQNITKRWNAGIDFRRLKTNNYLFFNLSGDAYNKIRIPSTYNVKLFTSYHTKRDKYYLLGSLTSNKIRQRETGGLTDPIAFDTTSGRRRVFDNPLSNATNFINQRALFFSHYLRFGKTSYQTILKDSTKLDTISFDFRPRGFFYHTLNASSSKFYYKDPNYDTLFYPKPIFGDTTSDSLVLREVTNAVGIVLKASYKQFRNVLKMGAEMSNYGIYNVYTKQDNTYNLSLNGSLLMALTGKKNEIELIGKGQYFIAGYNSGDYMLNAAGKILIEDRIRLSGSISSQRHVADYFQSVATTNHLIWNQKLTPTLRNGIDASVEWLPMRINAGFNISNFQNYNIYFFNSAPKGIDFSYLNLFVSHHIKLGKFHWHNRIAYQEISKTFNLPKLNFSGGVFYENYFFKHNMLARIGADYYWFSSYYADAFNPYLRQFVWQNSTKIGNYPYLDVYISAQVQTMNLYVRFEHINQGISGNRFYSTPNYPNPPRFFRFGVNWRIFN